MRVEVNGLLAELTVAQRNAVTSDAAPLCVLAGAGAGKTRVLTRRIAYRIATGSADPRHVLALTFTRKAAGELSERLRAVGVRDHVAAGTFHATAYAQLRRFWADRGQTPPALLDRKVRLLGPLAHGRPHAGDVPVAELAAEIEWAKARQVDPDRYAEAAANAGRRPPIPASAMAALYARYETEKGRKRLVDFDDLLARCADAIERDPEFGAAQRWRWRHVFVDEFQDANPLQHRLLAAWLGPNVDLCVVGDPNQAIYGWNGADPALLHRFGDHWPTAETVSLDDNHRCTPQVVSVAAAILGPDGARLRSTRPDGPAPALRTYPNERAEAQGVAAELRRAYGSGLAWSQLAILMRTNAQAASFIDALREAQVPYRVPGMSALFDSQAGRQALADLKARRHLPFTMVSADLADTADPDEPSAALATLAKDYSGLDPRPTVDGFLAWVRAAVRDGDRPGNSRPDDAVTLCTFHRAKGLEWPAVWIVGLEVGLVPIGHATSPQAEAEERRLLYVACTRAERELHCSWAETRAFNGGRPIPRQPSPWLEAVATAAGAGIGGRDAATPGPDWRGQLATQRRKLAQKRTPATVPGLPDPDPEVLGALQRWRAATARAAGVPPYVLFHDVTLAALAGTRPVSVDELLAVPGLGPVKASRYGTSLLEIVAEHRKTA
jgi:DNA helicase-2/ATP-dependent DNA helicase PcrA